MAGHIAKVVTSRRWEDLIREKALEPLGMNSSGFDLPATPDANLSYHKNSLY